MRVRILEIHEEDAFRHDTYLIGATGDLRETHTRKELAKDGWITGRMIFDKLPEGWDSNSIFFLAVKVEELQDE